MERTITIRIKRAWLRYLALIEATAVVAVPVTVLASNSFTDVSDANIFHDDIDWMAESGVTQGCGNGDFCPGDIVTRQQMSAFMHRFATDLLPRTAHAATNDGPDGADYELASSSSIVAPADGTIIIVG